MRQEVAAEKQYTTSHTTSIPHYSHYPYYSTISDDVIDQGRPLTNIHLLSLNDYLTAG